jgi:hypothetical protein
MEDLGNKAGRPKKWNAPGPTQTIRVPSAYAEELLKVAEEWDKKGQIVLTQKYPCRSIRPVVKTLSD